MDELSNIVNIVMNDLQGYVQNATPYELSFILKSAVRGLPCNLTKEIIDNLDEGTKRHLTYHYEDQNTYKPEFVGEYDPKIAKNSNQNMMWLRIGDPNCVSEEDRPYQKSWINTPGLSVVDALKEYEDKLKELRELNKKIISASTPTKECKDMSMEDHGKVSNRFMIVYIDKENYDGSNKL